jgi:ribosomal protein S18 acetylase RimI-like enzyme
MSQTIEIRRLLACDAALLDNVLPDTFDYPIDPAQARAFLACDTHDIVVALDGDLVVGMATGMTHLRLDKPPEYFIDEVGVHDDYLRRGIATRLSRALMQIGHAQGCHGVWLATETDNIPARGLYKSLGGRETEAVVVYDWGGAMDD